MWGNHHLRPSEGNHVVPVVRGDLLRQDNERLNELLDTFRIFDRNGDGHISTEELRLTMQILGQVENDTELGEMMELLDADGNGTIEFEEFACLMMRESTDIEDDANCQVEEVYGKAFCTFDKDKDGLLSREELLLLMESLLGKKPTEEEIQRMIHQADIDGDGYINYDEFRRTMMQGNW